MKNKILSITFVLYIFIFFILNIIIKDKDVSNMERRKLNKLPEFTFDNVINGNISNDFENYALDQFVLRDNYRKLKSLFEFKVYGKLDSNNLYVKDGYIFKIEYPLREDKVVNFTNKINKIYLNNLKGMNVYYSIIPDKNYYFKDNYLKMDYNRLINIVSNNINKNIKYIDITSNLELEDYYYSDIHWKQEKLDNVVRKLSKNMKFKVNTNYTYNEYSPFYGSYYGQLGLNTKYDEIIYLSNNTIDNAKVKDIENKIVKVYDKKLLKNKDSYDIYLGGPTPLIEVINNNTKSNKELVIFRDSFGSSLAPLLLDGYSKITLIDLRYIDYNMLKDYIKFSNQDVFFIYNTNIINNSDMLRV